MSSCRMILLFIQGRRTERQEYRAEDNGHLLSGKVIVLVNEFSASAAEIVTGALQDQDRPRSWVAVHSVRDLSSVRDRI